jgi:hypothetical protein
MKKKGRFAGLGVAKTREAPFSSSFILPPSSLKKEDALAGVLFEN